MVFVMPMCNAAEIFIAVVREGREEYILFVLHCWGDGLIGSAKTQNTSRFGGVPHFATLCRHVPIFILSLQGVCIASRISSGDTHLNTGKECLLVHSIDEVIKIVL